MFEQIASPACTELEVCMLDWLGKMLKLPSEFLASSGGKGGGVIQGTASEATLVALLGAKAKMLQNVKVNHPDWDDSIIIPKLIGYCSCTFECTLIYLNRINFSNELFFPTAQAHSSVERAGLLGGVKLRSVETDENNQMRGENLEKCIREDLDKGLIPFYVSIFIKIETKTIQWFQFNCHLQFCRL